MNQSFFLGNLLPQLKLGENPGISFEELMALYRENLSAHGWKKIKCLQSFVDLKNVEKVLKGLPINPRGTLSEKELKEALLSQSRLPEFLIDFVQEFPTPSKQMQHFAKAFSLYFREMEKKCRGFLKEYFRFERNWRIVFAGYRSKKLGVDLMGELQYEDPFDPIVAEILAQKDLPHFQFPSPFAHLEGSLKKMSQNPNEQYWLISNLQFEFIQQKMEEVPFSVDYFLGYCLQLMLVEETALLDAEKGNYLNEMMKDVV